MDMMCCRELRVWIASIRMISNCKGYVATQRDHELTLKLDAGSVIAQCKLLLTGWTDYAWSSDNLAASQSGKSLSCPRFK